MQRVLNTHTRTVHKLQENARSGEAVCGSLTHTPETRIHVVSAETDRTDVDRCGNCFENAGGY